MHTNFKTGLLVLPLALIVSSSIAFAKKPQYTEIEVGKGGSISGTIKFEGQVPPPVSVNLNNEKNSEFCLENATHNKQGELLIHHVEVKDKNLKDAVIFIQNIAKGKPWNNKTLEIHFKNCQAFPKVDVVRKTPKVLTNNLVTIENHDSGVLHNPKGFSIGEKNT